MFWMFNHLWTPVEKSIEIQQFLHIVIPYLFLPFHLSLLYVHLHWKSF